LPRLPRLIGVGAELPGTVGGGMIEARDDTAEAGAVPAPCLGLKGRGALMGFLGYEVLGILPGGLRPGGSRSPFFWGADDPVRLLWQGGSLRKGVGEVASPSCNIPASRILAAWIIRSRDGAQEERTERTYGLSLSSIPPVAEEGAQRKSPPGGRALVT
jgi:hypothetical protein